MDHSDTDNAKYAKDNLTRITTNIARALSRQGALFKTVTANVCKGYVQANIVMLPSKHSKNFAEFCRINSGPLPVLFASERGQFDAPTLTRSTPSDIRTDLEAYDVIENAKYSRTVPNLDEYTEELKDFCFYYLGSSVSFNDRLLSAGIPLRYYDENGDVANTSKYKLSVTCRLDDVRVKDTDFTIDPAGT
ncbi:hypothetical protein BSL78_11284 [Apostichopus japonicus]|uniref:Uncharacterized protein n=1 Tax=Stichopus japonicus TaxID=307972 RepID=A0A2G8KUY6_STIJA|nr:hypothetical protein BSL78_11284 [Apostichopus japonicus]